MGLLHRKEPEPTIKFYGRQFEVNVMKKICKNQNVILKRNELVLKSHQHCINRCALRLDHYQFVLEVTMETSLYWYKLTHFENHES